MKKIPLLILGLFILTSSFATVNVTPPLRADKIFFPVGKTGVVISLLDLSEIKIKDLEKLTGNKMKFIDRLAFKAAQRNVRNKINYDGTINSKKIEKFMSKKGGETGFHFGGFALGFFLGIIGVLISYIINDDYKRNRVKWSWIGLALWLGIWGILAASGAFGGI